MKTALSTYLILILFAGVVNAQQSKIKGISFVSVKTKLDSTNVIPVAKLGSNWTSLVTFCDFETGSDCKLIYNHENQYYGERIQGMREMIQLFKESGMSVMVKPQVREKDGKYVGHIDFLRKKDWRAFEEGYQSYILSFAKLSEEENVKMFCIGTELGRFVKKRKRFWKSLIKDVRKVYSGDLVYAANWDDYNNFPFWKELDFIGVDAYFPISKEMDPNIDDLTNGWTPIVKKMESVSDEFDKKIILTEYGYRSIEMSADKPWKHSTDAKINEHSQVNSLTALYLSIWTKDFIEGGFLWNWYPYHPNSGGPQDNSYTVQNKQAEEVVREAYSKD